MTTFLRLLALSLLTAAFAATTTSFAQEGGTGPINIIISYQCPPANRPAFREHMEKKGLALFEQWKREGIFADYLPLFNSFVDQDTWDMMVVLSFNAYVESDKWKEIEQKFPGGLSAEALKLASPKNTYMADLTWQGSKKAGDGDRSKALYFVIPYSYSSRGDYHKYFPVYVQPQFDGWVTEGVMSGYSIFLNNHATGKPWDVLFVLEYRDSESFALRDVVKQKIRDGLRRDMPVWPLIHALKHSIREEGETIMSTALLPQ